MNPRSSDEDPVWIRYQQEFAQHYHEVFYASSPVIRAVQEAGHRMVEKPFAATTHCERILEVGAGAGEHIPHVRHTFGEYLVTDLNETILEQARQAHGHKPGLVFQVQDCRRLTLPDQSVDRVISIYNLEHIPEPFRALKEWTRVLKPGGILSIAIPTEGGIAWNLGRHLTTRRTFMKKGFDWDYIIARDHVNACSQLLAFIRHYFSDRKESWFPLGVPSHHLNLICAITIRVP
ncbi:MAG: class I SAM-dependent methyltransferase [Magnetococcales bacterium]|nr:class I SAM-dependent methyltransferase [Magnetococcales bacterium]